MRRWASVAGVLLIGVAILAVPSGMVVESYVGGSATHGHVEGGRYFVNPGHGRPVVEVSEATWRKVYWVERLWPFTALVPGLIGLFLADYGKGPNRTPPPPAELPPWVVWTCGAAGVFVVLGTWLFWVAVRVPWATMLAGWALVCVAVGSVVWVYSRSVRRQPTAGPGATANR